LWCHDSGERAAMGGRTRRLQRMAQGCVLDAAGFDAGAKPRDIRERDDFCRELDVEAACSRIVSGVQRSAFRTGDEPAGGIGRRRCEGKMRAAATIVGNKDFNVITPEPEKTSGMSSKKASARNQRRQTILPGGKTAGDTWRGGTG